MNTDILVPILFLIFLFLIINLLISRQAVKRREIHQTLRSAFDNGQAIPEDIMRRLAKNADPRSSDLRKAILFTVLSLLVLLLAWLLPFEDLDGQRAFFCIALIPSAMALTYASFWRFWYKGQDGR